MLEPFRKDLEMNGFGAVALPSGSDSGDLFVQPHATDSQTLADVYVLFPKESLPLLARPAAYRASLHSLDCHLEVWILRH